MEGKCTNQPFLILMQTSRVLQDRIRDDMMKNNLSITEFSVLEVLFHKGMQTIHQIGKSVLITSGSMTYVIDRLEQKGFLKRSACPDDRRAIHVSLTATGSELMKRIMPEHEDFVDSVFGSLNSQEVDILVSLLKRVKDKVEN